jgi:hypothetical protein
MTDTSRHAIYLKSVNSRMQGSKYAMTQNQPRHRIVQPSAKFSGARNLRNKTCTDTTQKTVPNNVDRVT